MCPTDRLIADFAPSLKYFSDHTTADDKYNLYLETVKMRGQFSTVSAAIASDPFVSSLHETLKIFFGLARAGLVPRAAFVDELRKHSHAIAQFEAQRLGAESSDTAGKLWNLISQLKLTADKKEKKRKKDKSRLVSGSKCLHILLPHLIVPIDRQYTGAFLLRYPGEFESGHEEEQTFRVAFGQFRKIANAVSPEVYVGTSTLHPNLTKVIDNSIIGFLERARASLAK